MTPTVYISQFLILYVPIINLIPTLVHARVGHYHIIRIYVLFIIMAKFTMCDNRQLYNINMVIFL